MSIFEGEANGFRLNEIEGGNRRKEGRSKRAGGSREGNKVDHEVERAQVRRGGGESCDSVDGRRIHRIELKIRIIPYDSTHKPK